MDKQSTRLKFDVLSVRVGEQVFPDSALPRKCPKPEFLTGHLAVPGPVSEAVVIVCVIAAEEIVELSHNVVGLAAPKGIIRIGRQKPAGVVNRPGKCFSTMTQILIAGYAQLQINARKCRRRHPVVVRLRERSGVGPKNIRLKDRFVGRKTDLDAPVGSGREIHGPDKTAHASVRILYQLVIDGAGGRRCMPDYPEIEFDSSRRPWSAK